VNAKLFLHTLLCRVYSLSGVSLKKRKDNHDPSDVNVAFLVFEQHSQNKNYYTEKETLDAENQKNRGCFFRLRVSTRYTQQTLAQQKFPRCEGR